MKTVDVLIADKKRYESYGTNCFYKYWELGFCCPLCDVSTERARDYMSFAGGDFDRAIKNARRRHIRGD